MKSFITERGTCSVHTGEQGESCRQRYKLSLMLLQCGANRKIIVKIISTSQLANSKSLTAGFEESFNITEECEYWETVRASESWKRAVESVQPLWDRHCCGQELNMRNVLEANASRLKRINCCHRLHYCSFAKLLSFNQQFCHQNTEFGSVTEVPLQFF